MKNLKRFLLFALAVWTGTSVLVNAGFLGVKKSTESIAFRLHNPLDSAGIPGKPDSAHIFTYADNAVSNAYAARSTTYPFSDISIDTTKNYGDTAYWFVDAIADIDGPGGNVQLGIDVVLWYKKLPTHTFASVQVIADSLNVAVDTAKQARIGWDNDLIAEANRTITIPTGGITATTIADNAIGSTEMAAGAIGTSEAPLLANLDATVSSRSTFNASTDSVTVDISNLLTHLTGQTLQLNALKLKPTVTNDTGLVVFANGTAPAAVFYGTSTGTSGGLVVRAGGAGNASGITSIGNGTGAGLYAVGGATGYGGHFLGGSNGSSGLVAQAQLNAHGAYFFGNGAYDGIRSVGGATGNGATFLGGATSGYGLTAQAQAGNFAGGYFLGEGSGAGAVFSGDQSSGTGHGLDIQSSDGGGYGLNIYSANRHGAVITGGALNDTGLYITGSTGIATNRMEIKGDNGSNYSFRIYNGTGTAARIEAAGASGETAYHGLDLRGSGGGAGLKAQGGENGEGGSFLGGTSSGKGMMIANQGGTEEGLYVYSFADDGAKFVAGSGAGDYPIVGDIYGNLIGFTKNYAVDNIVRNGRFEYDSATAANPPDEWSYGINTDSVKCITDGVMGKWKLRLAGHVSGNTTIYQYIRLNPGLYILMAKGMVQASGDSLGVCIDGSVFTNHGWSDSLIITDYNYEYVWVDTFEVTLAGLKTVGIWYKAASVGDTAIVDNIALLPVGTAGGSASITEADKDEIARKAADSIWNEPRTGHTTAGTFGYYLDAQISSITTGGCAGSGDKTWNIVVVDTTGAGYVLKSDADITLRDMGGTVKGILTTDNYGKAVFLQVGGDYQVSVWFAGVLHNADTVTLSADGQTDTVKVSHTVIPSSGAPSLATLFLQYYRGTTPVKGAELLVRNDNIATDTTQDIVIGPYYGYAKTDANGIAVLYVPKSYLYHDTTLSLYDITLKKDGKVIGTWPEFYVPNQDTVRLIKE
ncbi:MAG: hypothetical protein C4570_04280 [Ammonifex sp.]|nr:MAG: hypothetical protein C4570_04280 [Ammonifex sp.]